MNRVPLTVTALTKYIKHQFDHDTNLTHVLLKGEISNFTHHSRGHFYFTLKDEQAQIRGIMFRQHAQEVKIRLEEGMNVIVEGYVSVYVASGSYQIQVTSLQVDGVGDLYVQFEQLKEKLSKQGLFNQEYKKPIPEYPKEIAVLTSPTGAAIRDIVSTIERRFKLTQVRVYPTLVQGKGSKDSIVQSLEKANRSGADVIILGRGGGSIEDLWSFNEEIVAQAIFKSKIPVISAVGHETDFTISDFVADLRAATPTAAAELAVPNTQDLILKLTQEHERLLQGMSTITKQQNLRLSRLKGSFIFETPGRIFEQHHYQLNRWHQQLLIQSPLSKLKLSLQELKGLRKALNYHYESRLNGLNQRFLSLTETLELVNPVNLLNKGYAILKRNGEPLTSVKNINLGDGLKVDLKDGTLDVEVIEKEDKNYDE